VESLEKLLSRVIPPRNLEYQGEPQGDICPVCKGNSFVQRHVRYGHPDWGKIFPCGCQSGGADQVGPSFENFTCHPNYHDVQLAYEATQNWSQGRGPAILVLNGPRGVGKTHLARAALRAIIQADAHASVRWMPDGELSDTIRNSYETDSWNEWKFEFKGCQWLIIDDLGSITLSDHMRSRYGEIIDWRWQGAGNGPPIRTMVTTNAAPDILGSRVESRLLDVSRTRAVTIEAPDYRLTGDTQA